MHICSVHLCIERLRAAGPGQPPLLRARARRRTRSPSALGVTRPQVSRLLKRARAEGIVEIRIVDRTAAEQPGRRRAPRSLRPRRRPSRPDDRRSRGPDPPDGRSARRRRSCAAPSATARSSGSATARRSRRRRRARSRRTGRRRSPSRSCRCAAATGRPAPNASRTVGSPRRSAGRRAGSMAPGLVDDAATQRRARRPRGRAGDPRPVGAPRRRAVRDRRSGLERGAVGDRGRARARRGRRGRRGPRRPVRPRWAVRLPGAPRAGHRLRCARARAASRSRSAWRPARARSARSSARCGPGVVRTLVTDVATAEAVVALDEATGRRRRAERPMTAREPAILGLDLGTTEVKAGLVDLDGRLLALARERLRPRRLGRPRLGGAGSGRLVVRGRRAPSARCEPTDRAEVVAIGVDGHGPTLAAVDARGEATRPAITFLDTRADRRGRRAGRGDRRPRLGARRPAGRALGRAPRAGGRRRDRWYLATWEWLAFRLDRGRRRAARPGPARRRTRPRVAAGRRPGRPAATARRDRATSSAGSTAAGRRRARPAARDRRSSAGPSTPSRATSAPACSSRATPTIRAARPAASASTGIGRSRSPGAFVTPAPLAGLLQRRGRDGRHRPGARLVPRRRSSAGRSPPRRSSARPPRRRPAPTASSSCRTSRASDRRSGIPTRAASSPA